VDAGASFAVSPDGRRVLVARWRRDPQLSSDLVVVQGWFEELKKIAGGR
jgi:hypothetical protein